MNESSDNYVPGKKVDYITISNFEGYIFSHIENGKVTFMSFDIFKRKCIEEKKTFGQYVAQISNFTLEMIKQYPINDVCFEARLAFMVVRKHPFNEHIEEIKQYLCSRKKADTFIKWILETDYCLDNEAILDHLVTIYNTHYIKRFFHIVSKFNTSKGMYNVFKKNVDLYKK